MAFWWDTRVCSTSYIEFIPTQLPVQYFFGEIKSEWSVWRLNVCFEAHCRGWRRGAKDPLARFPARLMPAFVDAHAAAFYE